MNDSEFKKKLDLVRDEERRRIARDVHDELGGDLAAIKMALTVLARRLPQDQELLRQLVYVDELVDGAIDAMHRVAEKWNDAKDGTLQEIIARQTADFTRQSGIVCHCELPASEIDLQGDALEALTHIVRECLTNVGKHARAGRICVRLRSSAGVLVLEIQDDGVGVKAAIKGAVRGLGVSGMQERTKELGGIFSILPAAPHGTLVKIELPIGNVPT